MLARRQAGDTIIEVMFSFAVFSLVIVSAIVLMNQGIAMAQRSLEISLVRQQIDSQVSIVKHAKQTKNAAWDALRADSQDSIGSFTAITDCPDAAALVSSHAHFMAATSDKTGIRLMDVTPATYMSAVTYSMTDVMMRTASTPRTYGLWMVLVKAEGFATNRAYDLHVRACWPSTGTSVPITIGTVTRMYDEK